MPVCRHVSAIVPNSLIRFGMLVIILRNSSLSTSHSDICYRGPALRQSCSHVAQGKSAVAARRCSDARLLLRLLR
ncbi:hypothetical protein HSE2_gp028 [Escherichia phage vB_EcoS_HSE2]|nr:hypothetical protein HSE2_gp028 [Escherichia phage vB_EcoS_HSE2]